MSIKLYYDLYHIDFIDLKTIFYIDLYIKFKCVLLDQDTKW